MLFQRNKTQSKRLALKGCNRMQPNSTSPDIISENQTAIFTQPKVDYTPSELNEKVSNRQVMNRLHPNHFIHLNGFYLIFSLSLLHRIKFP
jgi:hypothetical protein